MPTARSWKRRIVVSVLCLFAAAAHAQEISGPYVGLGAGLFNYEEESDDFGARISDGAGIYRIVGGYQLNSNYAIEASVGRSSDVKEQLFFIDTVENQIVGLTVGVETELKTLRLLAVAPFSGLSMFGSIGYFDADFTTTFPLEAPSSQRFESKSSDSGVMVAGGIQYEWPRIALRGEYEWLDTDDIDATAINVIAVFRF